MIQLTMPAELLPKGYQQIDPATATGLTVPDGAALALLSAEVDNIRFRDDGTAPTASTGLTLVAGAAPFLYRGDLNALSVIAEDTGAILNVLYYAHFA